MSAKKTTTENKTISTRKYGKKPYNQDHFVLTFTLDDVSHLPPAQRKAAEAADRKALLAELAACASKAKKAGCVFNVLREGPYYRFVVTRGTRQNPWNFLAFTLAMLACTNPQNTINVRFHATKLKKGETPFKEAQQVKDMLRHEYGDGACTMTQQVNEAVLHIPVGFCVG